PADLAPFATIDEQTAHEMIVDAMATAAQVAPCILDSDFEHDAAAKAIIRGALLRWHESQSGAVVTNTAGPFSQTIDPTARRSGMFWPSEIRDLAKLCGRSGGRKAHTIDMDSVA